MALAVGDTLRAVAFDRIEASGPFGAASSTAASLDAVATKDIASPSFIDNQTCKTNKISINSFVVIF